MKPVTDPALLDQLDKKPVADKALLAQLEGHSKPTEFEGGFLEVGIPGTDLRAKTSMYVPGAVKKGLANVGAGLTKGAKGMLGLFGLGDSDEQIMERRKLDEALADDTMGGGLMQLTGELAATTPLAMGVGGAVGKVATKAAPKLAAWAGSKGTRAFNLGTVGRGAVEGAVSGASAETASDESKGFNTAAGAVVGGALPGLFALGGSAKNMISKKNAGNRAAKVFTEQLGQRNIDEIADVLDSPARSSLPLSTAAQSENTALAALERGARSRSDWGFNHDRKVAEAAWDQVKGATGAADELSQRVTDYDELVALSKEFLEDKGSKTSVSKAVKEVSDAAQELRTGSVARQNPEVTNLLGEVETLLAHPDATPGDFASQYWRLEKKLEGNLTDEARTVITKLRDAVGGAADTASAGNHFSDMLGRVRSERGHVAQGEGAKAIRDTFMSPGGVPKTAREGFGSTPDVTASGLRGAIAKSENVLDLEAIEGLKGTAKELGKHELYKSGNSPGQSGLDIRDPLSIISSGRDNPFNYFPLVKGSANWLFGGSRRATTEAADAAMQSPDAWRKMMEAYAKSKTPLSPEEYAARVRRQLMLLPGRAAVGELGD